MEIHDCILNTLFGVVWCHCFRKQVFCLRMLPPKHQISDYISEQDAKWLLFQWNIEMPWHDSTRISWNKFLKVFRRWIINFIPAWDSDNFVLGIWYLYERWDSVEKLTISTDACISCLLLLSTEIFLSFR